MNDRQRKRLLDRINRPSSGIGEEIPERITVQGREVNLREFVMEVNRHEVVPAATEERVEEMTTKLQRERLQRRQRIETEDLSTEEAERLVESVVGIDRALNALDRLEPVSLAEEERKAKIADVRDWLDFVKQFQ